MHQRLDINLRCRGGVVRRLGHIPGVATLPRDHRLPPGGMMYSMSTSTRVLLQPSGRCDHHQGLMDHQGLADRYECGHPVGTWQLRGVNHGSLCSSASLLCWLDPAGPRESDWPMPRRRHVLRWTGSRRCCLGRTTCDAPLHGLMRWFAQHQQQGVECSCLQYQQLMSSSCKIPGNFCYRKEGLAVFSRPTRWPGMTLFKPEGSHTQAQQMAGMMRSHL